MGKNCKADSVFLHFGLLSLLSSSQESGGSVDFSSFVTSQRISNLGYPLTDTSHGCVDGLMPGTTMNHFSFTHRIPSKAPSAEKAIGDTGDM